MFWPYLKAQQNDDRDAEAIAEAAMRPTMRFVDLKSEPRNSSMSSFAHWARRHIRAASALALTGAAAVIDTALSSEAELVRADLLKSVLRRPLEQRFQRADIGDGAKLTGVVSLGGGNARVREAGRLGRLLPQIRIVLSDSRDSVALLGGGIDAARITLEERSRTTWENALFTKALVKPRLGERWLLITSAVHMPRAIGAFRQAGFEVEPWPVHDTPDRFLIYPVVRHEWLELIAYRLLGQSDSLFPGSHERGWPKRPN